MKMKLRKFRGNDDKLKILKLRAAELHQVRYVFENLPSYLLNKGDTKPTILDTDYIEVILVLYMNFWRGLLRGYAIPTLWMELATPWKQPTR